MDFLQINTDSVVFNWVILPILIVLARVMDQSIGTLRLIFLSKGYKKLAPILGFFEVIIWLLVITQIIKQMNNVLCYIAYGGGFALGNYLGLWIEEKLSLGNVIIRVIPTHDSDKLIEYLKTHEYQITIVDTENANEKVKMIFSVIKRNDLKKTINVINKFNPNSFLSVEDVKVIGESTPMTQLQDKFRYLRLFTRK